MAKVPILFLIFNRPEVTVQALESIRAYQPERLYVAADGPRSGKEGEAELCEQTRQAVLGAIDWPCEVKTLLRKENWGCAKSNYDSISWFFRQEQWGVIVEDDVVVSQDFYRICEQLLPHYQDEDKVAEISAFNQVPTADTSSRFVFSQSLFCWGWASWRRAWQHMDFEMTAWPSFSKQLLIRKYGWFKGLFMYHYWHDAYTHLDTCDSWATRWNFSMLAKDLYVLVPLTNLALNIGTSINGAHYKQGDKVVKTNLTMGNMSWPLELPPVIAFDAAQNKRERRYFFKERWVGLNNKIRRRLM